MILNPGQLSRLRDDYSHITIAYLSVMEPEQAYCGRISIAPSRGDTVLTVANFSGNAANVVAGQQVLVSSTGPGNREKSVRRIKSITPNGPGFDIEVDQNGVDWAMNDYLTVMIYWEPRPKIPYVLTSAPYTIYKDGDIAYSGDANMYPTPVAIMGPPWAGFLDGATVAVQLDGSDSYATAPGGSLIQYEWSSTGGAIAGPNNATTYITFDTPGVYWVYLKVTDNNGKDQTTRRPFFVHERTGANAPYSGFRASIRGSYTNGVSLTIDAFEDTGDWPENTLVVLWTEEFFDTVDAPIGGFANREHIRFVGYISNDNVSMDPEDIGSLTTTAVSIDHILSRMRMWSIALMDVTYTPTTWYEYKDLTVARGVHHLLRWHTTVLDVADVYLPTGNTLRKGRLDYPEGDVLGQMRQFATEKGIFTNVGCDKQGALHIEIDPMMIKETDRGSIDTVQALTSEDWAYSLDFVIREIPELAWGSLSGVNWDGADGTLYISVMPGNMPEGRGSGSADIQYQMLEDQDDSDWKVGLYFARHNQYLREMRVREFAGNYSHIDVFPQEFYAITIAAADNLKGLELSARKMIPRSYELKYDPEGFITVGANFEPETVDVLKGVPGPYPDETPLPPHDGDGDTVNPDPPDFPDPEETPATIVVFAGDVGTYVSRDAGGTWVERNTGKSITDSYYGYWDPWGPSRYKYNSFDPERAIYWDYGVGYIARSIDDGRHWYDVTPDTDPPNSWGDSPAPTASDLTYCHATPDVHRNRTHYAIAYWQNGSSEYRGWLLITRDDGASWTWTAFGNNNANMVVGQWGFPVGYVDGIWCWMDDPILPLPGHQPPSSHDFVSADNVCADDGAAGGGRVTWDYVKDLCDTWTSLFVVDLGCWITITNAASIGGVNVEAQTGTCQDTMTWQACFPNLNVDTCRLLPKTGNYAGIGGTTSCPIAATTALATWTCAADGYPPSNITKNALIHAPLDKFRYVVFGFAHAHDRYIGSGFHEHLWDYVKFVPASVDDEVRPISISMDWQDGTLLYVTVWEGASLRVLTYEVSDTSVELRGSTWLGDASRADIDARTYWACVKTLPDPSVADFKDYIVIYGRWNDGAIRHIATSVDRGETLVQIADAGWAAEWVGALKWVSQSDIILTLNGGGPATLERWNGAAWTSLANIDFDVDNGAMARHFGTLATLAIGQRNGDDIDEQDTPYTGAWNAIDLGVAASRIGAIWWVFNETP